MRQLSVKPFLGEYSAIDAATAPKTSSLENLNTLLEDGKARTRRGFRNLQASAAGFSALHGCFHVHGYNASLAEVDEYVCVETRSGTVQAHSRNGATMATTPIAGSTGLHASRWRGFAFRSVAYIFNRNNTQPLYRHTIADVTSWVAINNATDPTTPLQWLVIMDDAGATVYPQLSWAGTDVATDITYIDSARQIGSALLANNDLKIGHIGITLHAGFEVDLSLITAGILDLRHRDSGAFIITEGAGLNTPFHIGNLKFTLRNNDGSPLSFVPLLVTRRISANQWYCWWFTGPKADRDQWDNMRYVRVEYDITAAANVALTPNTPNYLTISKPFLGCCYPSGGGNPSERLPAFERWGQSFYNQPSDLESGIGGIIDTPAGNLFGYNPLGSTGPGGGPLPIIPGEGGATGDAFGRLGVWIKFTFQTSADPTVDNNRGYWLDYAAQWRRFITQTDATPTYILKMSFQELSAMPAFNPRPMQFSNLVGGFACRGFVGWLFKGGKVRYSAVGQPERLASLEDDILDDEEGADFELAPNYADEAVGCGFQVDEAIIVPGYQGIYAHTGPKPLQMTPFRKLAGSPGCAGPDAACRWKDGAGNQGIAYVDAAGEGIWFVRAFTGTDPDNWPKAIELSEPIRGKLRSFLIDEQAALSVTLADIELFYEEATDSLWCAVGKRAFVLRRQDLLTHRRQWHRHDYNLGGGVVKFGAIAPSVKRRLRWMRSDGKSDEAEWNSTTNAYIEGTNRDGGNAIPQAYWDSQEYEGPWRRWIEAEILRDNLNDRPSLQIFSERQSGSAVQVAAGKRRVVFNALQQGWRHRFRLFLEENTGPIEGVLVKESNPLSKGVR